MYVYLKYSKHGYEIAVVGESQRTASYAGIKVERVIIRTMMLSGAICGLMRLPAHRRYGPHSDHHHRQAAAASPRHGVLDGQVQPLHMIFTSFLLVFLGARRSEISSTSA